MGSRTELSLDQLKRRVEELEALLSEKEKAKGIRNTAELLNRIGPILVRELDAERLVQSVTDIATKLVGAEFGAFFHNVTNERGESYMLYTLSGVPREAFSRFPMPRNTSAGSPSLSALSNTRARCWSHFSPT